MMYLKSALQRQLQPSQNGSNVPGRTNGGQGDPEAKGSNGNAPQASQNGIAPPQHNLQPHGIAAAAHEPGRMTLYAQYAQFTAEELRRQNVPQADIDFVELNRSLLYRSRMGESSFREGVKGSLHPQSVHGNMNGQQLVDTQQHQNLMNGQTQVGPRPPMQSQSQQQQSMVSEPQGMPGPVVALNGQPQVARSTQDITPQDRARRILEEARARVVQQRMSSIFFTLLCFVVIIYFRYQSKMSMPTFLMPISRNT